MRYADLGRLALIGAITLTAWLGGTRPASAEVINSCVTYCHSLPPADGARKGSTVATPTNATLQGNHGTHATASVNSCAKCHPGAASYTFGHMTTAQKPVIKLGANLNSSPSTAQYLKGGTATVFSNQTSVPILGSCNNVNCHFGSGTDNWGSAAYASPDTTVCAKCHGAPPASGSHAKHFVSFGSTVTGCAQCHPNHAAEGTPFRHATSASPGGRNLAVSFTAAPTGAGTYTAGTHVLYPNYFTTSTGYGSCASLYCHGSSAPSWGGASLQCNSCHGASNNGDLSAGTTAGHAIHYNQATVFTNITGNNVTSAAAYGFACRNCHPTGSHANGPANTLSSAEIGGAKLTGAQYTPGTASVTDAKGFKYTAGSCSTNSCHANGQGGAPLVTVSWSAAATGTCVQCHDTKQTGATATKLSGKHDKHMNPTNNAIIGTNNGLDCVNCHAKTVSATTTVSDRTKHVNGFLDYSGARAGGSARYNGTTKVCSNVYCHSNGNPGAIVYVNMTGSKSWTGAASLSCNGCHGRTSAIGAPDYVNGGAAPSSTANSHPKHVAGATGTTICATCHNKTANATVASRFKDYTAAKYHLNGTPNVYFDTTQAGATASFTQSSGTCSNVTCHGGTGSSATWGATLNCQDCHGNGASASTADFGATFWNNGVMSKIQMTGTGSWAGNGHGLASGTYPGTGYPAANFGVQARQCEFCHDATVAHKVAANPFRLLNFSTAAYGRNAPCLVCHSATGAGVNVNGTTIKRTTSPAVEADHYGSKHSASLSGGQFCWDCHDPHGTGNTNQAMVRANPAVASDRTTSAPTAQSTTAAAFTLSATPTGTDFAKSAAPFNGVCNVCHTTTSHYTQTAGDGHNSGSACTACHSHAGSAHGGDAFTPVGGGVSTGGNACFGCHSNFQAAMSIVGTSRTASYHHVLGTSSTDAGDQAPNTGSYPTSTTNVYCVSCHVDHNYFNNGGTVTTKGANLRVDIATVSGAAPSNTDFVNSGTFGICVSCHSASLTRDTTNQAAGGVATTPIVSGSQYAASMHNYTTLSAFGTQLFAANCVKCHTDEQAKDKQTSVNKFGPHFSASVSILDDLGTGTLAQYREQTLCFRCHSQSTDTALGGTLKAANGKDWFGSNTMRSSAEDTYKSFTSAGRSPRHKISAYSGLHKANETLADIAAAKHVECTDCHNQHAAKFGNHSSTAPTTAKGSRANTLPGVLTGVAGVTVTTWGTSWGSANTYGQSGTTALPNATAEYQVCFKCHTNAMGSTGWFKNMTSAGQVGAKNLAWTDLSIEFNPNNASGHPIVAALPSTRQLTAAKLAGGWTPGSVMTCSDCHATDSTASKGPHGSSVKWMLAGVNKAWPYTSAAANGTTSGTYFRLATYNTGAGTVNGLFCLNCHTVTGSNSWHSAGGLATSGGEHYNSTTGPPVCVNCHLRVPHGGKISRLLQTTNAPVRYRANGASGTPLFKAWGTSTVNIKGSTFGNANFGSSCSEHSGGGSGGEAW
ncbi:CxxxxCH/CxxCH domain c-type cytochrome [Geomesophilobacter sediminis]|uniref:CxxxxCH/CxxCH domain-containing protein n=1 Tax=Geomesophilobacter sediminis TaxID=2798584 RepID=A0A8J7IPC0_9BACT|nr:CxxxxCH/CxxCH domain-containing protein [Geomesophilobacter sediminis]MBJ6725373.1 CxxxxCH/CxxCH domain-containing protein [Geomesophilobacter sediminis]